MGSEMCIRDRPDVLAEGRTYLADSSRDRSHNVALGLARIDGVLVPPGGGFSFNEATGPVSARAGFRRGYGIAMADGQVTTVPSIGGGICQVATTLFHAVFRAGLPIVERRGHLYWMPRYGRLPSGLPGLDATVDDVSGVDFQFANATDDWLRVAATVEGGYAVVRLHGVAPGWTVTIDPPIISNVVRPPRGVVERPDPTLARGRRLVIEHAENGMRVAIRRVVRATDGRPREERVFVAGYAPARDVVLVGTGGATA